MGRHQGDNAGYVRQPDKLLKALEAMTPLMIKMGVPGAKRNTAYTIDTYQAEVVIPEERL
jgi:hypothetical protein